jgi:hypothetical protein
MIHFMEAISGDEKRQEAEIEALCRQITEEDPPDTLIVSVRPENRSNRLIKFDLVLLNFRYKLSLLVRTLFVRSPLPSNAANSRAVDRFRLSLDYSWQQIYAKNRALVKVSTRASFADTKTT